MNEAAQIRMVLEEARLQGAPFSTAWYRSLRSLVPPAGCPKELVAEHADTKAVLREMKPYWLAAYEGRRPTDPELEDGMLHARRRLRDLLLSEEERNAEQAAASPEGLGSLDGMETIGQARV